MQATFFRKPLFWIVATVISAGMGYSAFRLFPIAFPIVSVDLKMDRTLALDRACALAQHHLIGPNEYSTAVAFEGDNRAKIYIQLDGGGVEKFQEVIKQAYFAPYFWQVRHFNPQEKHEATFYFMPDGRPYGFKETLPDSLVLPNLSKSEAEELAMKEAKAFWYIDFAQHTLVEHSTEEKPNGRIDHTLEYERTNEQINKAPFRVTIKVSGNKVTRTTLKLKVPEAFQRQYANMRSANNLIARYASTAMFLLYFLLGCLLGMFLLLRANRDWLLWRVPLLCAGFISLGMFLASLNNYSQWWIEYQTTDSVFSFIAGQLQAMIVGAGFNFVLLYVSFAAAESLTRKAFPSHIQLWASADTQVASSWQLLGRTIGGYLMISFDFLFVTLFYLLSIKYLGWWSPADTLVDPNVLANYAPWFSPFINAVRAGFWEECLFRAVPLASAMILARKYGKKYWWMTGAMIVQALIFAGAHASYPAQPSYARLVELIIPSLVFGGLYLAFGLIPAIISHVTYDLILMALPILISDAPGSFWNKAMVLLCGLIPLLVVLHARFKKGRFHTLSERWYNYNWLPAYTTSAPQDETSHTEPEQPTYYRSALLITGLLACAGWALVRQKTQDVLPLLVSREQVLEHAHEAQTLFNISIPADMKALSITRPVTNKYSTYVWRVGGKEVFNQLKGTFVNPPLWKVRYAQFDGDIASSAEEYSVYFGPTGAPFEFVHTLPKEQDGASITEDEARAMTYQLLSSHYKLSPDDVIEVTAHEEKQPNRRDWEFIYRLKNTPDLKDGQLRIRIQIGGDKIVSHDRLVHIPEEWERTYAYESKLEQLIKSSSLIFLMLLIMLLGIFIIRRRPVHPFAVRSAFLIFGLLIIKSTIQTFNLWPIMTAHFPTSVPYSRQIYSLLTTVMLSTVMIALFFAWLGGYLVGLLRGRCTKSRINTLTQGLSIGVCATALQAIAVRLAPATKPLALDYNDASAYIPALSMALKSVLPMIGLSLVGWFILHGCNMLSDYGRKNYALFTSFMIVMGITLCGFNPGNSIIIWIISGCVTGLIINALYYIALRYNYCLVPIIVATSLSLDAIQDALLQAFPGVHLGACLTVLVLWTLAFWLMNQLRTHSHNY